MDKELKTYLEGIEGRIDKRFDGVDKRFDGVDKHFDSVKVDMTAMETRIGETIRDVVELVDKRFDGVDERFEGMDKRFDDIEEKLTPLVNQVSGHDKRVAFIEERVL